MISDLHDPSGRYLAAHFVKNPTGQSLLKDHKSDLVSGTGSGSAALTKLTNSQRCMVPYHHLLLLIRFRVVGRFGDYPNCHRVRGRVHPGQVTNLLISIH